MRIAIGGISHETSTFAKQRTTLEHFKAGRGLHRGDEIISEFRDTNICTGGFIEALEKHDCEIVPLLWTFPYPSGLIDRKDYDTVKAELIERLRDADKAAPLDGALLDLHGAMVVEGIDDGDGDVIAAVREVLGPDRPIMVTQDLHGNHTRRRVELADALIGFDTYPHVDMAERGHEAGELIVATIGGKIRPTMAIRQLSLLWSPACQVTAHPPMDEVMRRVHEAEARPGVLSVTLSTGFPWSDVPEACASVIAVTDDDPKLAQETADELATWVWENRQRWYRPPPSVRDAVEEGMRIGRHPIILADSADNTGGGSPGDSTEVLRTFLELGLEDALLLYMVDPEVAKQAHAAGLQSRITLSVGGKSDPAQGPPVEMDAEVVALSEGEFQYDGPMYRGLTGQMGPSAWLRQDGVSVVVVTAREQPLDPAFARSLGIDCASMRVIGVKSAVHFRSGFEKIAGSIHNIAAAAIHSEEFKTLIFSRRKPMFPAVEPPDPFAG